MWMDNERQVKPSLFWVQVTIFHMMASGKLEAHTPKNVSPLFKSIYFTKEPQSQFSVFIKISLEFDI